MNITKLIDSLQVYRDKNIKSIVVHNTDFTGNQLIEGIELDKNNCKQVNLIIDNIFICDALRVIKKNKSNDEMLRI